MALNILVYLAEYLAQNFLGMDSSEMNNEIPQYRSIVQEQGIIAGLSSTSGPPLERVQWVQLHPSIFGNGCSAPVNFQLDTLKSEMGTP